MWDFCTGWANTDYCCVSCYFSFFVEREYFEFRQRKKYFPSLKLSDPTLGPTESPIRLALCFFPWNKVIGDWI